jgi:prepilin-type N-terminal cleavage/methylation domain-containing protein
MKKGFTLMEVLAVLLLIAVVLTLAVPTLRAIRQDMRNQQARAAMKKMAEALDTFYVETRGGKISQGCFTPDDGTINSTDNCVAGASGKPNGNQSFHFKQLFACGYLEAKDFVSLPYKFCNYIQPGISCPVPSEEGNDLVIAVGLDGAGTKYQSDKGCMYVGVKRRVADTYQ